MFSQTAMATCRLDLEKLNKMDDVLIKRGLVATGVSVVSFVAILGAACQLLNTTPMQCH